MRLYLLLELPTYCVSFIIPDVRPSIKKKFQVERPGEGLVYILLPSGNFFLFFHLCQFFFCLSQKYHYFLKILLLSDWQQFWPPPGQETIFLRVA